MCIELVFSDKPKPSGFGYKVFDVERGNYHFEFQPFRRSHRVPRNRWLRAETKGLRPAYGGGFHIFAQKAEAESWAALGIGQRVVRVRYRNAYVQGLQNDRTEIVALEMFVPSKQRRK